MEEPLLERLARELMLAHATAPAERCEALLAVASQCSLAGPRCLWLRAAALCGAQQVQHATEALEDGLKARVLRSPKRRAVALDGGGGAEHALACVVRASWDGWALAWLQCAGLLACCYAVRGADAAARVLMDGVAVPPSFALYAGHAPLRVGTARDPLAAALHYERAQWSACVMALEGLDEAHAHALAGCALLQLHRAPEALARLGRAAHLEAAADELRLDTVYNLAVAAAALPGERDTWLRALRVLLDAATELRDVELRGEAAQRLAEALGGQESLPHWACALECGRAVGVPYVRALLDCDCIAESLALLDRLAYATTPALAALRVEAMLRAGRVDEQSLLVLLETLMAPGVRDPLLLNNAAVAHVVLGRPAKAASALRRARELDPASPLLTYNQTLVLLLLERPAEAAALWRKERSLTLAQRSERASFVGANPAPELAFLLGHVGPVHAARLDLRALEQGEEALAKVLTVL